MTNEQVVIVYANDQNHIGVASNSIRYIKYLSIRYIKYLTLHNFRTSSNKCFTSNLTAIL